MVVESLLFCLREGASRGGLPYIDFLSASRIHPPPSARPFSKGLLTSDYLSFAFTPLRGSILRLRRAPSLRGYPLRVISLSLSYRCGDPFSAFGAPFSKGLPTSDYLIFAFAPLRGSILRLRRAPSLRGYSLRDYLTFAFIPLRRIGFKQSQAFPNDIFYVLPHIFEVVLDVKV